MKKILFIIALMAIVLTVDAQGYRRLQQNYRRTQQDVTAASVIGFDKSKLTFGGGLGLQFGDYTLVNIAPQVGYNFTNSFNAGAGISYTFYKENIYGYNEKRHYAGFDLYARYYPIQYIVLMAQPEINRMWRSYGGFSENKFVPSVVVGAGVRFGPVSAMLKYDVAQNDYSPYGSNIFYSIGFGF